jgi:hypothetical protein
MAITTLNLTVPVPCTQGFFGDQIVCYVTQVRASQIVTLLGHDPQSKSWSRLPQDLRTAYEYLQRKTTKSRREAAKRYIRQRIAPGSPVVGAFPPIAIGVVRPLDFQSYKEKFSNAGLPDGVGELQFSLATSDTRILLDGLGRVSGALELIEEGNQAIADSFTFGLAIYAPIKGTLTPVQLGQLFHDFNFLAVPVSAGQAIDLDQSDPHIAIVNTLSDAPVIKDNGGIEPRAASLGTKSTALVAKRVFLRFVRAATEGPAFLHTLREVPADEANVTIENVFHNSVRIERFLTQLADQMGPDRFRQRDSIHLTAPGWNAMAVIYHDIEHVLAGKLVGADREKVIAEIALIDWSRANPDWVGLLGDPAKDENGIEIPNPSTGRADLGKLYGGQQAITKLVNYMREKTSLGEHLKNAGLSVALTDADLGAVEAA